MAKTLDAPPRADLYERDYYSWALEQATLLRARRFAELDLENLAEEVEDLARREAKELQSRYETLLAHLRRTADELRRWGAPEALVVAGLAHAVYGTDGFPQPLAALDERPDLQALLGTEAEAIVYEYAASDRSVTWRGINGPAVPYRDRFTGDDRTIEGEALQAYWTLTVANELDLVPLVDGYAPMLLPELARGRHLLPPAGERALAEAEASHATT